MGNTPCSPAVTEENDVKVDTVSASPGLPETALVVEEEKPAEVEVAVVVVEPEPEVPPPVEAAIEVVEVVEVVAPATPKGFVIVMSEKGVEKDITFTNLPLGMTFSIDITPVTITKMSAGGEAEKVGVKVGMTIEAVAGKSVKGLAYKEVWALLVAGVNSLK
ncbi:unnamed protein product [Polarella glacialis]|uniref:PDZ domain-containing protein n=1 Tax=Polarella glacialis TaxID=89957 RepID=A0A813E8S0_POLGL|nr:unnamed protein product [Polarella glacialis]CAE8711225.1 unnamed protein product [Polarella glacialis]